MHLRSNRRFVHSLILPVVCFALSFFAAHQLRAAPPSATKLVVTLKGIRNSNGMIVVRLWASKDGFPSDDSKAFRRVVIPIANGQATATFADVPEGTYAVSAFHDENGNGKFDTRFPRIPTEGYAITNDVRGKLGPPPFGPAQVQLNGSESMLVLTLHY